MREGKAFVGAVSPRRLLVVEREPTPYKVDLWNASHADGRLSVRVLFSVNRDWSPQLGHLYEEFPEITFAHESVSGRGIKASLHFVAKFLDSFVRWRPHIVYVTGYSHLPGMLAIVMCLLTRTPYVMFSDALNISPATTLLGRVKQGLRDAVRRIVFCTTRAMLVCGSHGRTSTILAGCPPEKVLDFPYVVDVERLRSDTPPAVPEACRMDLDSGRIVVLFSGRMIPRKGLPTLLKALSKLSKESSWILWCEGEGPERVRYEALARELVIADRCRFLGFCQMSLHSWLMRNTRIVVVPSLEDRWGIVVDEAMQLGKIVVSTNKTGSAIDRIVNGRSGVVVAAGDADALAAAIAPWVRGGDGGVVGSEAIKVASRYTPRKNSDILCALS